MSSSIVNPNLPRGSVCQCETYPEDCGVHNPDPGPTCKRPGCRNPRICTHSIAETAEMLRCLDNGGHRRSYRHTGAECPASQD